MMDREISVRSTGRLWRSALALQALTLVLFLLHIGEEVVRGVLGGDVLILAFPIVLSLALGTALAYRGHLTGLGLALGADLWIVIVAGYTHFSPRSSDWLGNIAATWGGALGLLWAAVAFLLWVAAAAALALSVRALRNMEGRALWQRGPAHVSV